MSLLARVETAQKGRVYTVRVCGEIDISNADEISDVMESSVPNTAERIVVDLSELRYLDSSGIAAVFRFVERLRGRRQEVGLVVPTDAPVRRLLEIAGLLSRAR